MIEQKRKATNDEQSSGRSRRRRADRWELALPRCERLASSPGDRLMTPDRSFAGSDGEREKAVSRKDRYLVGLDVGTSKIAAIVGETTGDARLDIIGLGLADSRGIRRGRSESVV